MTTWTTELVLELLEHPHQLLQHASIGAWIQRLGGLDALYAALATFPLPERLQRVLHATIADPGAPQGVLAQRLHLHRTTLYRAQRSLAALLLPLLNTLQAPAPAPAVPPRPSRLPQPLTPFIGRSALRDTITDLLLHHHVRLLSLVGPGGIGKTRLALDAGMRLEPRLAHGVAFIPLASINDPARLLSTIITGLGLIIQHHDRSLPELLEWLQPRHLLLIIDNAEHLLDAMPLLSTLLTHAPGLRLLVTSRVRLNLYGEHMLPIPGLDQPRDTETDDLARLEQIESVQLFTQRARALVPAFQLTPTNASSVVAICQQLGGMALALELAATQVLDASVATIHQRLSDSLSVLQDGPRDVDPRLQSMQASLQWSYDLLSAVEQQVLRSVGILIDGWTLDDAVALHPALEAPQVTAALERLAEQQLVMRSAEFAPIWTYGMLEPIRQFARHKAAEVNEIPVLRLRSIQFWVALSRTTREIRFSKEQIEQTFRLHALFNNLEEAFLWIQDQRLWDLGLVLLANLHWWWRYNNHIFRCIDWLKVFMPYRFSVALDQEMHRMLRYINAGFINKNALNYALEAAFIDNTSQYIILLLGRKGFNYIHDINPEINRIALDCHMQALAYADESTAYFKPHILLNIGFYYFCRNDYVNAINWYNQSLIEFSKGDNFFEMAVLFNNYAHTFFMLKMYDIAKYFCLIALEIYTYKYMLFNSNSKNESMYLATIMLLITIYSIHNDFEALINILSNYINHFDLNIDLYFIQFCKITGNIEYHQGNTINSLIAHEIGIKYINLILRSSHYDLDSFIATRDALIKQISPADYQKSSDMVHEWDKQTCISYIQQRIQAYLQGIEPGPAALK